MKVSVVVPVYNQESYIHDALDSLVAQTMSDIEFIIVNDGSTDRSLEIIQEYAERDSRFVVVDKENGGVASAINLGNQMAKGEYLAEMDSDDYVAPDMYEKLYETAVKHDLDIVKSNVINFTGSGDTFKSVTEKIARPGYFDRVINPMEEKIVFSFPMYAWVSLYRRDLIVEGNVQWNDGVSSYNDNGFYWQTMSLARRVMYLDEDFIYHRRDNEMSTVKNPDKMFRNFFLEHEFITKKLISLGVFEDVKPFFFERKINNYYFALNVIPYEKKHEFFQLVARDFRKDIAEHGLKETTFVNENNKKKIIDIVGDPDRFFYNTYVPNAYKVSVVIPVHNAEKFLRGTLESLLAQRLREAEFILVENGSTDGTQDIIDEFKRKDPRFVSVSIGPSNAGAARNVGLDMAHGQYIIFLDADDEYHPDLLTKSYDAAKKHNAEIVWFNSREKNAKNGLTKGHPHAYRKSNFPKERPFAFSALKGNPFDSFIGWPWDKLYSTQYIRSNCFSYQELDVSNDGYFNFLAMANAKRIVPLDDVLITRVVEHGSNISSNKHDLNPTNQLRMLAGIHEQLSKMNDGGAAARAFAERSTRSVAWMFNAGFQTREGASKYFDLIADGALDALDFANIPDEEIAPSRKDIHAKIVAMQKYQPGEYQKFVDEIGGSEFEPSQAATIFEYHPNPKIQDRLARLIFGQPEEFSAGKAKPWFNIILTERDTNNVSAMIDFIYMDHFKKVVRDTLYLSIALHRGENGTIQPAIHQAEWKVGEDIISDNILLSFSRNILTVHAKYPGRFTGFEYRIRHISTREGVINFSVVNVAQGFDQKTLYDITPDIAPVKAIRLKPDQNGFRTVFRKDYGENSGQDIFAIDLERYQFNNVVLAVDVTKIPNNRPASYDTLYLGMFLDLESGAPKVNVFQAEWLHGRKALRDHIYYYQRDGVFVLGGKFFEQWAGYNVKITSAVGREVGRGFTITKRAPDFIEHDLPPVPEDAVFINDVMTEE